jgi:glycosyltransferase involved in cell wall biosynthesis
MRVGVNCIRISPSYRGGVHSFTFGLLDAFVKSRSTDGFVIFATKRNVHMFRRYERAENFRIVLLDNNGVRIGRALFNLIPWWIRFRLPYRAFGKWLNAQDSACIADHADVHYVPHCPTPIFPFPAIPSLHSLHDLQHVQHPEFFTAREIAERNAAFGGAISEAPFVQASSRQMANEFADCFPTLAPQSIVVIPEGVDIIEFMSPPPGDIRKRYGLPERFLLYPAQLWPHKNHVTLLKALAALGDEGIRIPLILTGARYSGSTEVLDFIEKNRARLDVKYLGAVSRSDIVALYHSARFLVTSSLYESSSIPVLEAAAAGTPIIASAIPSHAEQAQHLQMELFPPTDSAALAELLRRAWNDDELIKSQMEHNRAAIQEFSWQNIGERYLQVFEHVIAQGKRP